MLRVWPLLPCTKSAQRAVLPALLAWFAHEDRPAPQKSRCLPGSCSKHRLPDGAEMPPPNPYCLQAGRMPLPVPPSRIPRGDVWYWNSRLETWVRMCRCGPAHMPMFPLQAGLKRLDAFVSQRNLGNDRSFRWGVVVVCPGQAW